MNRDVLSEREVAVELGPDLAPASVRAIVEERTGEAVPFSSADGRARFTCSLGPGDGALFRVCAG